MNPLTASAEADSHLAWQWRFRPSFGVFGVKGLGFRVTGLWLAGNDGMEKKMETTIGYIRTIRIHSFIPS